MLAGLNQCRATIGNRSRPVLSMSGKTRHKGSPDRLLLISCSKRKRADYKLMPAIDRYDGPAFYVLRRYLREIDDRHLSVYILSAEFGIINVQKLIPYYDRLNGLRASGLKGFCNRATHNLWVLLNEARWLQKHLEAQTYERNYRSRLDNSTYLPLIEKLLEMQERN